MERALARAAIAGAATAASVKRGAATGQFTAPGLEIDAARSSGADAQYQAERRTVWVVMVVATGVAAALRFPFLDRQSLWFDEIFTRQVLGESSLSGLWHHIQATESTPPLYYFLGRVLHAHSAVSMRLIPAVALTAAVPVGYLAFRRFVGSQAALATASILAVNPMLVAYATDARSYGLFVLTALLSLWAFGALFESQSRRRFALWVGASAGCLWTHYFGTFLVLAEVVVLLIARPRARLATAFWTALLGACLVPLVWLVASQAGDGRAEFIARIPLTTRLSEAVRQFAMGANVPRGWLEVSGVAIFCLAVAAGAVLAVRSRRRSRVLVALATIAVGASLLLAVLGVEDRLYARNAIVVVPLASALAAPAMLRLRATPLAVYLALAALTSVWVATDWRYEQVDWRSVLARSQAIDPRAAVVAVTRSEGPVVQAYLARHLAPSIVLARRAWIIVEPLRAIGDRFLSAAPAPRLSGFTTLRSFLAEGFRLVLVGADRPQQIAPAELGGASVFPGNDEMKGGPAYEPVGMASQPFTHLR
jgi:hypothetical protein